MEFAVDQDDRPVTVTERSVDVAAPRRRPEVGREQLACRAEAKLGPKNTMAGDGPPWPVSALMLRPCAAPSSWNRSGISMQRLWLDGPAAVILSHRPEVTLVYYD